MRFAIFKRGQFALEKRKRKKEFANQDAKKNDAEICQCGRKRCFLVNFNEIHHMLEVLSKSYLQDVLV